MFFLVPAANEPTTYATRLKSGTGGSTGVTSSLSVSPQGPAKSLSSPVSVYLSFYIT